MCGEFFKGVEIMFCCDYCVFVDGDVVVDYVLKFLLCVLIKIVGEFVE